MRITNEQANKAKDIFNNYSEIYKYATDLLEARERINEMSQTLLTISQYPIASVCEDVRTLARNEWEKSKEYAE
jgi:hypothetical protein